MKKLFFLLFIGIFSGQLANAQGWELFFNPEPTAAEARDIKQTLDGNYIVSGFTPINVLGSFGVVYRKIDEQGQVIWQRGIDDAVTNQNYINNLSDNTYITFGVALENVPGVGIISRPKVIKLGQDGEIIWQASSLFPDEDRQVRFQSSIPLDNGNFIFIGRKNPSSTTPGVNFIGEMSGDDGNLLWTNELSFVGTLELRRDNGNLVFSEGTSGDTLIRHETDSSGNLINSDIIPTPIGFRRFIFSEEETYLVSDGVAAPPIRSNIILSKLDVNFNLVGKDSILFEEDINITGFELLDNHLGITGFESTVFPQLAEVVNGFFMGTDLDLNISFTKTYQRTNRSQQPLDVVNSHQTGFILCGGVRPGPFAIGNTLTQMYVFKTDNQGNIYSNVISGTIAIDANNNCMFEDTEVPAENWIVTAHKPGLATPFGTVSDAFGAYELPVDTGNYTIHLTPQSGNWESCNNDTEVNFTAFQQAETVDFPISSTTDCPAMVVSLAAPLVRPCLARPVYLTYCNAGSVTATDAFLEVQLDPLLTPVSSSIPWDNLSTDNLLTWNIGDLEPLECGDITFFVELDCEAEVGIGYCLDAHVFPDTTCMAPSVLWSGAFLEVTGACVGEEINFEIKNIGTAPMLEQSSYIIVEDAVLRETNETDLLAPQMGSTIQLEGNGSVFTLLVDQVPNAPGNSNPIAVVEGCGTNDDGEISINFTNQFPNNDFQLHMDTECPVAVNSFDPNDKNAVPVGFQTEHFIEPATPLEYTIRFQNTGTDTAFLVEIRDTLDQWLDLTTFQEGVSSHPYVLGLTDQGHLSFTFYGIALLDSASNQAASNGFVDFKITPRIETPVGTVITNQAGIYFDYNEPVITNETFHTIIEDHSELLVNTVSHPVISDIEISVIPNPFQSSCVFQIENHEVDQYQLTIFDATGKLIRKDSLSRSNLEFERKDLSSGLYFYRLTAEDGFLSTGRLVVN